MKINLHFCITISLVVMHASCRFSATPCHPIWWKNAKREIRNGLEIAQMKRDDRIIKRDTGRFYKPDHDTWQIIKGNRNAENLLNNTDPIVGEKISLPKPEKLPYAVRIRENALQGEINVEEKSIEILCWDSGNFIDGDIITLYLDGQKIKTLTLREKSSALPIRVRISPKRKNHLLMFANNEGSVRPNTASLSINNTEITLSANQRENAVLKINYRSKKYN